jgi:WD40 repeat protein
VYDVATWQRQFRLEDHADWVLDIAWSPDGAKLVTASRDKTSKVFDAKSGDALTTFNSHGDVVFSAGFLADNASVVSAGRDKRLRVWKAADAAQIREIGGFGGDVLRIEILPEDKVLSAGGDMHVRLHNAADGAQIRDFAGHQDWVYAVGTHPGTNRIASGSYDGEVRLWNLENGEVVSQWIAAPGFQTQQAAAK